MLRPEQIEDQLQFMISTLIQRELRDPDLGFLTLTAVRVTGDHSIARIYFTVLGDQAQLERARKALGRAAGFLRTHLAKNLKMRRVPELQFFPDATLEEGNKIEAIFAKIKEEEAARPPVIEDEEAPAPPADGDPA
jgi:ribosome-binding factor A